MSDFGYRDVIEECLRHKVKKGDYINSCAIRFNDELAHTFEIDNKDTPRQVRSVLSAFMEHYHHFVEDIMITPIPEKNEVNVVLKVSQDKEYEFAKVFNSIYTGVKNEVKEAEAVLENAKNNL